MAGGINMHRSELLLNAYLFLILVGVIGFALIIFAIYISQILTEKIIMTVIGIVLILLVIIGSKRVKNIKWGL